MEFSKVEIFGVGIDDCGPGELIEYSLQAARKSQPATFAYANVHVLNTAYENPDLIRFLNGATVVYCDGFGVRLGAALKGKRLKPRITGAAWIDPWCRRAAQEGHRIFIVAGKQGVAKAAAEILTSRYMGLTIVGASTGYLDESASQAVLEQIDSSKPQVVFIGMGTPGQEAWIARHRKEIRAPLVWAVGALFDFVAGVEKRGSRLLTTSGFEWLARLAARPRRRWRRYLIGNPVFVWRVLRELARDERDAGQK